MTRKHDVLSDPLLSVELGSDPIRQRATLCQVFGWLSDSRALSFVALQPHQRHPWHAFLVQLGAIALDKGGCTKLPTAPYDWEQLLLALTDGAREPWCLVVDALDKPALLQPPIPEGTVRALKKTLTTPDALDILLTTRNFDVKQQRATNAEPQHWLFALVTKQTFEGFSGRDNHGVSRMNGGFGNRPCVSFSPSRRWSDRFARDVAVWLQQRDRLVEHYDYDLKGPALLWLLPWDGKEALSPLGIHPFFIEVCRRLRLQSIENDLCAYAGNSTTPRLDAKANAGDMGDIWTPIQFSAKAGRGAAMTVPSTGFHYRKIHELLFGDWQRPPGLQLHPEDGMAPFFVAMALARGQGKTDGYHERWIPIPAKARGMFAQPEGVELLHARSRQQLTRAVAGHSVLKPALCTLLQGSGELDFRDKRVDPWIRRLEHRIDDCFFSELFDAVSLDVDAARIRWDRLLVHRLRTTFDESLREISTPSAHQYRTTAAAETRFRAALRKSFPGIVDANVTSPVQAHA